MQTRFLLLVACLLSGPAWAQGGLYAYAPGKVVDAEGNPIIDRQTGKPQEDGFCIFWKPGLQTDNSRIPIVAGQGWFTGVSYSVDPRSQRVTVYEVYSPEALQTPDGLVFTPGRRRGRRTDIVVPMYSVPHGDWPCTQKTWNAVEANPPGWVPDQTTTSGGGYDWQRNYEANQKRQEERRKCNYLC